MHIEFVIVVTCRRVFVFQRLLMELIGEVNTLPCLGEVTPVRHDRKANRSISLGVILLEDP